MQKVEGPRVDRQFIQQPWLKVGLSQEIGRCFLQNIDCPIDQSSKPAMSGSRAGNEQRQRPYPLVRIGFGKLAVLQHRHRPPAEVVIQPGDGLVNQLRTCVLPWTTGGQHRLGSRHDEKGTLQGTRRLMLKQVAMELPIGRQQLLENQLNHGGSLPVVTESRIVLREAVQLLAEYRRDTRSCVGPFHHRAIGLWRLKSSEEFAGCPPGSRICGARRKVQIPQQSRERIRGRIGGSGGRWHQKGGSRQQPPGRPETVGTEIRILSARWRFAAGAAARRIA